MWSELVKQVHIFFLETICQTLKMTMNQKFERKIQPYEERHVFYSVELGIKG